MRRCVVPAGMLVLVLVSLPAFADTTEVTVADQLAAAKKAGAPVFLLVTEPRARDVDAFRAVVEGAAKKPTPAVRVVELDRSQKANKDIVKRYGVAGTRAPFALVLAHNGAPGGGVMPGEKAEEKLLALLPSPRKADALLALFERKAAFVVVGRPKMAGRTAALAACTDAVKTLEKKGVVIEVDLDDKAEKAFLELLGADAKAKDVVVHVYGLSGLKTGIAKGTIKAEELVTLARKKQQCCPTGKCG